MNYLVTGGAGFIGSHIVEELLRRGKMVRVLDNFSTGKRENIERFRNKVEFIEGDIRSYHIVREAVEGVDVILHQAALPSVPRSIRDPITSHDVNLTGTLNVLQAAKDTKVRRIVCASSSSVYGNSETLPLSEWMLPNPLSPYAVSKLGAEKYAQVFSQLYGLETVCLRYFNVFGERQDPNSQYSAVIPLFITAMMNGIRPRIFGDGSQSRDFTYVGNVVEANMLAATRPIDGGYITANCACSQRVSLMELVSAINQYLGTSVEPECVLERTGDIKHSFASIDKIREKLGFEPVVSFHEGLKKTCDYYTKHD